MRSEFEIIARRNGWNLTTYPDFTGRTDYVNTLTEQAWTMFQYQQSKVDELQNKINAAIKIIQIAKGGSDQAISSSKLYEAINELEQALKGSSDENQ